MNAYPSLQHSLAKSQKTKEQPLPANCDFMKYLQPSSEAIQPQQQNGEEYEDVYKTLSSGVYESSDAFEPEEGSDVYQQIMEQGKKQQGEVGSDRDEELYQSLNGRPGSLEVAVENERQDEVLQQKEEEAEKQYEKVQTVMQNAVLNTIQQKLVQSQSSRKEEMQNEQATYPSLEHYQPIGNQAVQRQAQQEQEQKIEVEFHEVVQMTEKEKIVQKQLESSIQICVEESMTLPESEQNIVKPPKKQPQLIKAIEKPRASIPQGPKLQFKSIQVNLQKFSSHQQHGSIKVAITGYEQQFFLKIQTQVFKIDISSKDKQYAIKRRFSQFLTLQKLIRHYYPGYILYPFPEKSLEFFKKLKLSFGSQQEKIILIEKRLFELERYLKFLVGHREIATSIVLEIFLDESTDVFQRETSNLLAIMQDQEKELQLGVIEENYNSIKKLMKSGFSFINSYIALSSNDTDLEAKLRELQAKSKKNNELFETIHIQLEECSQKLSNFATNIERLAQIYRANSQVSNIQSSIDSVLKLSSKMSSSRSFSQRYCEWIQDNLLYHIRYYEVLLRTIRHSIEFRAQLLQKLDSLTSQSYPIGDKIEQKIQLFEQRFVRDWSDITRQFDHNLAILYQKFNAEWKMHCRLMAKIWH